VQQINTMEHTEWNYDSNAGKHLCHKSIKQTNYVHTTSAICGVKTEHERLKCVELINNISSHSDLFELVTSLPIRGIQMGGMSKLG
jgi:hypothetical protein